MKLGRKEDFAAFLTAASGDGLQDALTKLAKLGHTLLEADGDSMVAMRSAVKLHELWSDAMKVKPAELAEQDAAQLQRRFQDIHVAIGKRNGKGNGK